MCELTLWIRLVALEVYLAGISNGKPDLIVADLDVLALARHERNMGVVVVSKSPAQSAEVISLNTTVRGDVDFHKRLVPKARLLINLVELIADETLRAAFIGLPAAKRKNTFS